jgi:hypothetical protein
MQVRGTANGDQTVVSRGASAARLAQTPVKALHVPVRYMLQLVVAQGFR